jgi:CHASE3 domain sensor protein
MIDDSVHTYDMAEATAPLNQEIQRLQRLLTTETATVRRQEEMIKLLQENVALARALIGYYQDRKLP